MGTAGPDLLTVDQPATVDPGRLGGHARSVGAGVGLGEQLAPDDVLVERRADPAGDLVVGRVLDERQDVPAGDAVRGSLHARGPELLLDDELLHRSRLSAERLGPVRHDVARVDQLGALLLGGQTRDALGERLHLDTDRLGLGRQLHGLLTGHPPTCQVGQLRGGGIGLQVAAQHGGPPHVEVGVVLPGDGDAAVHLGVEVGAEVGGGRGQRCGDGGRVGELVTAGGGGTGGVPHGAGGQLGGHDHVGAVVLDRLEHGDRPTELDALLGVLGGHLGALAGHADRLGGQDHPGQVRQVAPGAGQDDRGGTVQADPGGAAGRVHVGGHLDGDALADPDHGDVLACGDQQHLGEPSGEHVAGVARGNTVADGHVAAERHGGDDRAVGQARQQRVGLLTADRSQHGAGDHRRHERAGRHRSTELLDDHDELLERVPRTALGLGHVQTQPAQPGEFAPPRRQPLLGRLEQRPCPGAGAAPGQEVSGRLGQCAVVVGDGDGHAGKVAPQRSR